MSRSRHGQYEIARNRCEPSDETDVCRWPGSGRQHDSNEIPADPILNAKRVGCKRGAGSFRKAGTPGTPRFGCKFVRVARTGDLSGYKREAQADRADTGWGGGANGEGTKGGTGEIAVGVEKESLARMVWGMPRHKDFPGNGLRACRGMDGVEKAPPKPRPEPRPKPRPECRPECRPKHRPERRPDLPLAGLDRAGRSRGIEGWGRCAGRKAALEDFGFEDLRDKRLVEKGL